MHACDNISPPHMLRTPSKRALAKYYDLVCFSYTLLMLHPINPSSGLLSFST